MNLGQIISNVPMWALITAALGLIALLGVIVHRRRVHHKPPRRIDLSFDHTPAAPRVISPIPEPMIAVSELELEYRQRSQALNRRDSEINGRKKALTDRKYETLELVALLAAGTKEERTNLATILKLSETATPAALSESLGKAGSHVVGALARGGRGVPYLEVVTDVAAKLKLPKLPQADMICERERQILTATFEKMLAKATPEQREAILAELASKQLSSARKLGAGAGALMVANLSGFALYTAASTTLAAVTGALGLTLPFATYMGLSSVIATVTGPLGWAALVVWGVASLGGADYKKTIPAVILVSTVRTRLIAERDQELQALADEQAVLERKQVPLRRLRAFLDALGPVPKGHQVRVRDVPR